MLNLLEGYTDKAGLAAEFGCSARKIERLMNEPDGLPHIRIGNKVLFRVENVRSWLSGRETQRATRRTRAGRRKSKAA